MESKPPAPWQVDPVDVRASLFLFNQALRRHVRVRLLLQVRAEHDGGQVLAVQRHSGPQGVCGMDQVCCTRRDV